MKRKKTGDRKMKNWIPITISIFAILISGITCFYQIFYNENKLSANLIKFNVENNEVSVSVVFVNTGTEYSSILQMRLFYTSNFLKEQSRTTHFQYKPIIEDIPRVMKPNELFILDYSEFIDIEHLSDIGINRQNDYPERKTTAIGVDIIATNSKGERYETRYLFGEITTVRNKIYSFNNKNFNFLYFNLFSDSEKRVNNTFP